MNKEKLASFIDHTLLAPNASSKAVEELCGEAMKYHFASVCVNPCFVKFCKNIVKDCGVKVCTVIGFPLGATTSEDKKKECENAIQNGADEVDMVINISAAMDGNFEYVENDIRAVVSSAKEAGEKVDRKITVKVILETCFLSDEQIVECSKRAVKAGANFVKTSTGFANAKDKNGNALFNGATVHHVKLMSKAVGSNCEVKASGGIRTKEAAAEMIKAGASRLGTSSGVKIYAEWDESLPL